MKFPKNNNELDVIYKKSKKAGIKEFTGDYRVNMLTGSIPDFSFAGHCKRFYLKDSKLTGHNIVLKIFTFGHFVVEKGECKDFNKMEAVILNYGKNNNILTKNILDKLRKIEEGVFLGRYYSIKTGKPVFKGYFSLIRK